MAERTLTDNNIVRIPSGGGWTVRDAESAGLRFSPCPHGGRLVYRYSRSSMYFSVCLDCDNETRAVDPEIVRVLLEQRYH